MSILLRAALHTLRDRITISESLHLLAQMPMFLKALYVDQRKYQGKPRKMDSMEEFRWEAERVGLKWGRLHLTETNQRKIRFE